jgi:hypothetical protein
VTTSVAGRPVAVSLQNANLPTPSTNPADMYQAAEQFTTLLKAPNTGSINDMLKDGYRFPGGPSAVPANELFYVSSQDDGVFIFDAWYLDGSKSDAALSDLCDALALQSI